MAENDPYYHEDPEKDDGGQGGDAGRHEQVRHRAIGARVPDDVGRGVFSTGAIVMTGGTEFVIDFVQRMGRPHQIVARIVVPHSVMPRMISALRDNLEKYKSRFGDPPALPKPPEGQRRPNIQEVYDELKLPDDTLSGAYANAVMIAHSASEFSFDFITNFFPTSAVSRRVFLSAPQANALLESLGNTYKQFEERVKQQRHGQPGDPAKPDDAPPPPPGGQEKKDDDEPGGDVA